ncbi:synaptobrevin isoform X1 [Phycodurus eques]|uniref:synaptobrevin isoform X1 n=1 Tax=Phycodurus eques TaxID=693459 RepID=UPI002ACE9354|nr:synaptobrevin isoform X1 [Phycodurus eques]
MSAPDAAAPGAPGAPGADGAPAGAPPAPPNTSSNRRLQQTQAQVEEVVDIMRVNVDKVLERDQKLSELDDRADALQAGASQFESCAAKLKNKYWWKNCKMMIMMGIIGVIVVGIIFCEYTRVSSMLYTVGRKCGLIFQLQNAELGNVGTITNRKLLLEIN